MKFGKVIWPDLVGDPENWFKVGISDFMTSHDVQSSVLSLTDNNIVKMLARFRASALSSALRSPGSLKAPSSYKTNIITSPPLITTTQVMEVKRMTKTLRTKSAAKKRFRVTANGHLKCWPSSLHGKSRVIKRAGLRNSTAIHMTRLLSNSGWKPTIKSTAKSQYLLQDQEFDGI